MAETQATNHSDTPKRRTRSDAGKQRTKGGAGAALIDVLAAIKDLSQPDMTRVLSAASTFYQLPAKEEG